MNDTLLFQLITVDLDSERAEQYEILAKKNQTDSLTAVERETLIKLREEADLLMYRRAYAAALLT